MQPRVVYFFRSHRLLFFYFVYTYYVEFVKFTSTFSLFVAGKEYTDWNGAMRNDTGQILPDIYEVYYVIIGGIGERKNRIKVSSIAPSSHF